MPAFLTALQKFFNYLRTSKFKSQVISHSNRTNNIFRAKIMSASNQQPAHEKSFSSYTDEDIDMRNPDHHKSQDNFSEYQEQSAEKCTPQSKDEQKEVQKQSQMGEKPPKAIKEQQKYSDHHESRRFQYNVGYLKPGSKGHRSSKPNPSSPSGLQFYSPKTLSKATANIGAFGVLDKAQYEKYYAYGLNKAKGLLQKSHQQTKNIRGSYCQPARETKAESFYQTTYLSKHPQKENFRSFSLLYSPQQANKLRSQLDKKKSLEKSSYWNGSRFDYLASSTVSKQNQSLSATLQPQITKTDSCYRESQKINEFIAPTTASVLPKPSRDALRNITSGVIVDRRKSQHKQAESSSYIRIQEEDPKTVENEVTLNSDLKEKDAKNKHQSIPKDTNNLKSRDIVTENEHLRKENDKLRGLLLEKSQRLQEVNLLRLQQSKEFEEKLVNVRVLFEEQKARTLKSHEQEIQLFKQVNKKSHQQALKERQIQNNLLTESENMLHKTVCLETEKLSFKIRELTEALQSKEAELLQVKIQIANLKAREQGSSKVERVSVCEAKAQHQIPKWISNFLKVFQDMVRKLPIELNDSWESKKIVIVGWKVIKRVIEKAVKLGIKMPRIITNGDDQPQQNEQSSALELNNKE